MAKTLFIFAIASMARIGFAQEPVKVTTTLHDDGSRTEMKSDLEQRTAEASTLNAAGKLMQRIVYRLDEDGQPAEGTIYSPTGAVLFKATYKRDPANRLSEEIDYANDGTLLRRFVYEYSGTGKVSKIRMFDAAGNEVAPRTAAGRVTSGKKRR